MFDGDDSWRGLPVPEGDLYAWDENSTYVKNPPFFDGMTLTPPGVSSDRRCARPCDARRFDHHRPHLSRWLDSGGESGRESG